LGAPPLPSLLEPAASNAADSAASDHVGVALIAAKSYYFGVGGSVADFCALVQADHRFACESVRIFEDGQSNRREVLQVRWRDAPAPNVDQSMGGA
jgi:hypothetical protein